MKLIYFVLRVYRELKMKLEKYKKQKKKKKN